MPIWRMRKRKEPNEGEQEAPDSEPVIDESADEQPAEDGAAGPSRRRRGTRGGRKRKKPAAGSEDGTLEAVEVAAEPVADAAPTKSRRRRTKASEAGEARDPAAAVGAEAPAAEKPKRASRRKAKSADPDETDDAAGGRKRRKRATPRRSQLPPVAKRMLVSVDVGETRVAILEEDQVVEVYLERRGHRSVAGNIYKGVVDNVLPGMEASFVDIGLDRNGFLYVDEIVTPDGADGGRRRSRRISELVSRGQHVLVQAVKDPMGTKGARLTTEISLPGRFVVYVPYGDGIGVSRRLDDAERDRLKAICKRLEIPGGGLIVRTAAEGASEAEIVGDLEFLARLWATIVARAEQAPPRTLVYKEADLPLRLVRDLFIRDFAGLVVDHPSTHERLAGYLRRTSPELASQVVLERGPGLMERHGVDAAIASTLSRRVDLPSGGYLVFDYAEALTVIDVNTGRFVGPRGRNAAASLEDTITANNLEAAREVVRQLRLRDIGGIIVIDFIDMENAGNRKAVEQALARELERDRTKTYVVEISPLGLVEMTRQNVTDGPREIITDRCAVCNGEGVVPSRESVAIAVERSIRRAAEASTAEALLVELAPPIVGMLVGPGGSRLTELEGALGRKLSFEPLPDAPLDHVTVLAEGSAAEIEPRGLPVEAGQELELTIDARSSDEPDDGVARVDGYAILVGGAGGLAGKAVRARIERLTRTTGYAARLDASAPVAPAPVEATSLIDADVELEPLAPAEPPKPKRARRSRKAEVDEAATAVDGAAAEPSDASGETPEVPAKPKRSRRRTAATADAGEPPPDTPVGDTGAAADEEAPAPKRTRRRSSARTPTTDELGGLAASNAGPPAELAGSGVTVADVAESDAGGPDVGETVLAADQSDDADGPVAVADGTGEDGVPRKRRTRRGSRGGRGRKRKVATDASPAAADGAARLSDGAATGAHAAEEVATELAIGPLTPDQPAPDEPSAEAPAPGEPNVDGSEAAPPPKRPRRSRAKRAADGPASEAAEPGATDLAGVEPAGAERAPDAGDKPAKPRRTRTRKPATTGDAADGQPAAAGDLPAAPSVAIAVPALAREPLADPEAVG